MWYCATFSDDKNCVEVFYECDSKLNSQNNKEKAIFAFLRKSDELKMSISQKKKFLNGAKIIRKCTKEDSKKIKKQEFKKWQTILKVWSAEYY